MDKELRENLTLDLIDEKYRPIAEMIGIDNFVKLCEYVQGDEIYIPMPNMIYIPVRNKLIREQFSGYNAAELSKKYKLSKRSIQLIACAGTENKS